MQSILRFILLTYALSRVFWIPMIGIGEHRLLLILGTFGPTAAALALTGRASG